MAEKDLVAGRNGLIKTQSTGPDCTRTPAISILHYQIERTIVRLLDCQGGHTLLGVPK